LNSAFSCGSPVWKDFSDEGAFTGVGSHGGALGGDWATGSGADILFAHVDEVAWIDERVATSENTSSESAALFLGKWKVVAVHGAWWCGDDLALALCRCFPWVSKEHDVLDVVAFNCGWVILNVAVEVAAETSNLIAELAAELHFNNWLMIPEKVHAKVGGHLDEGGWDVTDDNAIMFVWKSDADVIEENFTWKKSENFSCAIFADLESNGLGADSCGAVFALLVLNPYTEWVCGLGVVTWLDKDVLAVTGEVESTTIERCEVGSPSNDATTSAVSWCTRPFGSSSTCAFFAFGCVWLANGVWSAVLGSHTAALFWDDALGSIEHFAVWAEAAVDALWALAIFIGSSSTCATTGLATFHMYHAVFTLWCGAERFRSPVKYNTAEYACAWVLLGSLTEDLGAGRGVSLGQTWAHVFHAESLELGRVNLGVALLEWAGWARQKTAGSLGRSKFICCKCWAGWLGVLGDCWDWSLVGLVLEVGSQGELVRQRLTRDGLEFTAHTAHLGWLGGKGEDRGLAVVQQLQVGYPGNHDVWGVFGEDKAIDRCGQMQHFPICSHALRCQHEFDVFHLNLNRRLTTVRLTSKAVVDCNFVQWVFFAFLHHRVGALAWVGEGLLVKVGIVLTPPGHAHGVIMELVFVGGYVAVLSGESGGAFLWLLCRNSWKNNR
jgi:hypothetical protein